MKTLCQNLETIKFILNIVNKELIINPDWDEDSIMRIFELISNHLKWGVPNLPKINRRIDGMKHKCSLKKVKEKGINNFIKEKNIFYIIF